MMGYFKPLRRKIGGITLVIACLFMAGWVRSYSVIDSITLPTDVSSTKAVQEEHTISSYKGHLIMKRSFIPVLKRRSLVSSKRFFSSSAMIDRVQEKPLPWNDEADSRGKWRWRFCGVGAFQFAGKSRLVWHVIPYATVAVPLTLLSAGLLLSKPRAKKLPTESPPQKEP